MYGVLNQVDHTGRQLVRHGETLGIAVRSTRSPWRTAIPRSCGWTGQEHGGSIPLTAIREADIPSRR
jgi:hypothetical protein